MHKSQITAILQATEPGTRVRVAARDGLYHGRLRETDPSAGFVRIAWGAGWYDIANKDVLSLVPERLPTRSAA